MSASIDVRLLAAALCVVAASPAAQDARSCRVQALQGQAALIGPAAERKPLVAGMALAANNRLGTGKASWIDVLCSDRTRLTVGAETEIDIGTLIGERGPSASVAMQLHAGIARFLTPVRSWASFRVGGPAAVASVRQTEWIVEAPQGATNVFVVQGRVRVDAGKGGSLELSDGDGVDVTMNAARSRALRLGDAPSGKLDQRKTWSAERVDGAMQRLGLR